MVNEIIESDINNSIMGRRIRNEGPASIVRFVKRRTVIKSKDGVRKK
jgi:hypothetical protein